MDCEMTKGSGSACAARSYRPKNLKFCAAPGCGDWFMPTGGTQKYCSDSCSKKVNALRLQAFKKCKTCGKPFVGATDFCETRCAFVDFWKRDPHAQSKMPLVERLYKEGRGLKAIAKEAQVARSTLRNWIVKAGIKEERKSGQARRNSPTKKGDLAKSMSLRHLALIRQHEEIKKKKAPKQKQSFKDLELFKHAEERNREKNKVKKANQAAERARRADELANQKGFKSDYHLRYSTDPAFKARELYKRRFQKIVQGINGIGHGSKRMMALLGCETKKFQYWIESQWEDWMNWDNIGKQELGKWQIDHIIPCSWFDHCDAAQLQICWHYLNLRPLCAVKNRIRGANPSDLIETIKALPDHPMKAQMLEFASMHTNFYK